MNRGRGHFTPSPRGGGRGGWSRSSPSSAGSSDRQAYTPVGAEQSSPNSISSGTQPTSGGGTGESSWHRNDRFSGGQQTSGKSQTMWKPVASKASSGEGCSPSSADLEARSPELNYRAEIVDGGLMQSEKSDLSSYYTKKGSADRSPRENHGSPRVNSSDSSKSSSQRNERPSGQRRTSQQRDTDWVVAKPVAFKGSTQFEKSDLSSDRTVGVSKPIVLEKGSADGPLDLDRSLMKNLGSEDEKSSVATAHNSLPHCEDPNSVGGSKSSKECDSSQQSECVTDAGPFDICPPKAGLPFVVKPSLLDTNRENRKQRSQSLLPKGRVLRSGMVLLKNYIPVSEQVNIVKECCKLGLGTGGFYRPGYRDGAKLNLRMMCLGKNWDPETNSYGNIRPSDDAKPPPIPIKFLDLVIRSIKESHSLISEECGSIKRAEAILPWISPDICIVNFYTTSGRLGLHKDKDESEGSLRKGLPVVSVSIGDSAEFLYGDEREVEKAEKVSLESGDVLIFGGDSRHVFHGVDSIQPNTAPKSLLKDSNLRPGRLNLTFRQY